MNKKAEKREKKKKKGKLWLSLLLSLKQSLCDSRPECFQYSICALNHSEHELLTPNINLYSFFHYVKNDLYVPLGIRTSTTVCVFASLYVYVNVKKINTHAHG